jgi:thiamine biosynthesis lipoprotein
MKDTRLLMGMPITVEIIDERATMDDLNDVYLYFDYVDHKFSTYKDKSEISRFNRGEITREQFSQDMTLIFELAEQTKRETGGYFDIRHNGLIDPSGIVKGWAIYQAAELLWERGFQNFYVDAGGDVQVVGCNERGEPWRVGVRNPFNLHEIVKVLSLTNCGVATSGTSIRGQHIYDPVSGKTSLDDVVSLTVIGPNVYEADRFATAAFAMGEQGIAFIEQLDGFEGYMIDRSGQATLTSGLERVLAHD